jgi:hypothetical protein
VNGKKNNTYLVTGWGGKVPPILLAKRPNKYGYFLLLSGLISSVGVVMQLVDMRHLDIVGLVFNVLITGVMILSGLSLLGVLHRKRSEAQRRDSNQH